MLNENVKEVIVELRKIGVSISTVQEKLIIEKFNEVRRYVTVDGCTIDDIKEYADENFGITLSDIEALRALRYMDRKFDSNRSQNVAMEDALDAVEEFRNPELQKA